MEEEKKSSHIEHSQELNIIVAGPSGCGKSSFIKYFGGLDAND
jgi:ABC-type lipoprotein export system ATPase subunit